MSRSQSTLGRLAPYSRRSLTSGAALLGTAALVLAAATSGASAAPPPRSASAGPVVGPHAPAATKTRVLLGSSFNGSSVTSINGTTAMYPTAKVGRYYFPGNPTTYSASNLKSIPAAETIFVSFKTDPATVKSGAYNATFKTVLASWNASGRTIFWTWQHEADNPAKSIKAADYVAGWNQLLSVARTIPSPNVHSMTVLMAYALAKGMPHGDPASWYVAGVDVLGFDCYLLPTEKLAEAYALSKGKRLAFPEFGDGIVTGKTDAQALAFARAFVTAWTPNVFAASWYNSGVNTLAKWPATTAYLRSIS